MFDVESMLIMVCYLKKICGINQGEDQVTWLDLLHQHTSMLVSFREWWVVSAWPWIRVIALIIKYDKIALVLDYEVFILLLCNVDNIRTYIQMLISMGPRHGYATPVLFLKFWNFVGIQDTPDLSAPLPWCARVWYEGSRSVVYSCTLGSAVCIFAVSDMLLISCRLWSHWRSTLCHSSLGENAKSWKTLVGFKNCHYQIFMVMAYYIPHI